MRTACCLFPVHRETDVSNSPFFAAAWLRKLRNYRGWFLEQDKMKSDESKRPGKAVNNGDLFGFEGSFRKLNVD
jgi:hypothetical protein